MSSDNVPSRLSVDSTYSTSPFIKNMHQPSPNHPKGYVITPSNGTATRVKLSVIVMAFRILALISGLCIGISFAILGARWESTIALIVFTWFSVVWDALVLVNHVRESSLRISLVLSDGKAIRFGNQGDDKDGDRRRHCHPRAFWVDLVLLIVVLALNVFNTVRTERRYHRTTVDLNWIAIAFHIVITLLTAVPALATAHLCFEPAGMPQISLP